MALGTDVASRSQFFYFFRMRERPAARTLLQTGTPRQFQSIRIDLSRHRERTPPSLLGRIDWKLILMSRYWLKNPSAEP
jgi:hypothetical protein